jgi:hypothetical protein
LPFLLHKLLAAVADEKMEDDSFCIMIEADHTATKINPAIVIASERKKLTMHSVGKILKNQWIG